MRIYAANEKLKETKLLDYYCTDLDGENVRCRAVTPTGELDGRKNRLLGRDNKNRHRYRRIHKRDRVFHREHQANGKAALSQDSIDTNPDLPPIAHSDALNSFLVERLEKKRETVVVTREKWWTAFKDKRFKALCAHILPPGHKTVYAEAVDELGMG